MKRLLSDILCVVGCLLIATTLSAQNTTSSPSSRYGLGEINDNVPSSYRAMGGLSTGVRSGLAINPSQPASYTACDSTSFMFDFSGSLSWTRYRDDSGMKNTANGNLDYLTLQFPIWKQYIAFSGGVLPYSSTGYEFALSNYSGGHAYTVTYGGEGGISQVYAGLSGNILDWFAVGANFYYMFGDITNATLLTFDESDISGSLMYRNMHVNTIRFRYGAQLFHTFGKHELVLGGTFENKRKMGGNYLQYESNSSDSIVLVEEGFETPMSFAAGLSYSYANRLTIGVDYSQTDWSKALYFNQTNKLLDRRKIVLGVDYRHNDMGLKYAERMHWRAGAALSNSYVKQLGMNNLTLAMGVGFPLRTTRSMINLTVEYNHRLAMQNLKENNLTFIINVTAIENWFFKRKL